MTRGRARLVAIVVGTVAALVLGELGMRTWLAFGAAPRQQAYYAAPVSTGAAFLGHTPLYQPHHWLVYTLRPGYQSAAYPVRHNQYGFRGPELTVEKPETLFRVVAIGASTTYGIPVTDDTKTYPARLEHHLRARYPGVRLEVVNAGVGGYTSGENLINLVFKVLDLSPDLVVIYHAHNDVHPRRQPRFAGDYTGYRKIWHPDPGTVDRVMGWSALARVAAIEAGAWRPESVYKHTTTLVEERPRGEEYEQNFRRSTSRYFRRNVRAMVAVARDAGSAVLLSTAAYFADAEPPGPYRRVYEEGIREHGLVTREVAQETGVGFFDFGSVVPVERALFADTVHLTEAGQDLQGRLFAERIAELRYVDRWLERARRRS